MAMCDSELARNLWTPRTYATLSRDASCKFVGMTLDVWRTNPKILGM
jgi:hypothetical protein